MQPGRRHSAHAALLFLLVTSVTGIVLETANPLLDFNDQLLKLVLSGPENEVVSPAALYNVIAAAHQAGNNQIRDVIQKALGTDTPGQISQQIADFAKKEPSLKHFFRAYSSPRVLSECATRQINSLPKKERCARLTSLLSPPTGQQLDLGALSAVREINSDVSEATDGLIPDLFTQLDPDTRLVLAAALGFSSEWLPELTILTKQMQFRRPGGVERVPGVLVSGPMRFLNASADGLYGVAMPYNDQSLKMEMFFFMAADPRADVVPLLQRGHYEALAAASPLDTQVVLTFPQFAIKSAKHDYRDVARAIGLDAMLAGGLGPNGADKVDQLVHRAVIDVDEKGTRAAGAAGISIIPRVGSDETTPRVVLQLDRPFVGSVMHVELGLPLFTAHVVDPQQDAAATDRPAGRL